MKYKKIAQLAEVSVSTVSKALSGSSEISTETAERIRKIASEHGVVRPKYNKETAKKKVAIVVPEIISYHYSLMLTALIKEIRKNTMEGCVYITDFKDRDFCNVMEWIRQDEGICGLICFDDIRTTALPPLPMVSMNHSDAGEYDTVCVNPDAYFSDILKHLISLGHERIGYIGERNTGGKDAAFHRAAQALKLTVDPRDVFISGKRFEEIGREAARYFLKQEDRPTALVTAYDEIALGAIHVFQRRGVRIPEDISIVGINNIPHAVYLSVPLTTVHTYNREMMTLAVNLLKDRIDNPRTHITQHILVNGKLVIRDSTAKAKNSSSPG